MKKKTTTHEQSTEQPSVSSPRRAKLIKKQGRTSTKVFAEKAITPHHTNWCGTDGHLDIPIAHFEERVSFRAYERFLDRGGYHGQDLTDWLEAEREIMSDGQYCP